MATPPGEGFVYKPGTYKGPVFLTPADRTKSPPKITVNGQTYTGRYINTNEGRHQFVFPKSITEYENLELSYDGQKTTLGKGWSGYRGDNISDGLGASNKGALNGPGGSYTGGEGGGYANPTPYYRYQFSPEDAITRSFGPAGTLPGNQGQLTEAVLNTTRSGTQFSDGSSPFQAAPTGAQSLSYLTQAIVEGGGTLSPRDFLKYIQSATVLQPAGQTGIGSGMINLGVNTQNTPPALTGAKYVLASNADPTTGAPTLTPEKIDQLRKSGYLTKDQANDAKSTLANSGGSQTTQIAKQANTRSEAGEKPSVQPDTVEKGKDGEEKKPSAADRAKDKFGVDVAEGSDGGGTVIPKSQTYSDLTFTPVVTPEIPRVQSDLIDPLLSTARTGNFNTDRYQAGLNLAQDNAFKMLGTELSGNAMFIPGMAAIIRSQLSQDNAYNLNSILDANAVNRGIVAQANENNINQLGQINSIDRSLLSLSNQFNQDQRLKNIESAIPGFRKAILRGIDRGETYASGRLLDDAQDRAFEVASRSAAADISANRGFGDDSVFGRTTSELLSAEKRLGVSQMGDQMSRAWLQAGYSSLFDQPVKQTPLQARDVFQRENPFQYTPQLSQVGSRINPMPSISGSQLMSSQAGVLGQLNTIDPTTALNSQTLQNTGNAQLLAQRNSQIAGLDFNAQQINSGRQYDQQLTQISGGIADQRYRENAAQGFLNSEAAFQQMQQALQMFMQYLSQAQQSQQTGDIFSGITQLLSQFGLGDIFKGGGGVLDKIPGVGNLGSKLGF